MLLVKESTEYCKLCDCRIKKCALFESLSEEELSNFKCVINVAIYDRKDVVYMEQDLCKGFHFIRRGRIKIVSSSKTGKEQIVKIVGEGGMLGLEAFRGDGESKYRYSAIAMEETELCFLKSDEFFDIINNNESIMKKFICTLGTELEDSYVRISNMGLMSAKEKIANFLISIGTEYGVEVAGGIKFRVNMSRMEIGELLGITQETSIRIMKRFVKDGLLEMRGKEMFIKSPKELLEIASIE